MTDVYSNYLASHSQEYSLERNSFMIVTKKESDVNEAIEEPTIGLPE